VPVALRVASLDAWWSWMAALAGPLAAILASLPAEATAAIGARLRAAAAPYATPAGLVLPGVALLATGHARHRA
jgi:hypothetical protein